MSTKSRIPLTEYEERLPQDYKISLFDEEDNSDMEKDILSVLKEPEMETPYYIPNPEPFKYRPKLVIGINGKITEIIKKGIVWMEEEKLVDPRNPKDIPKKRIEKVIEEKKESLLENIINFLGNYSKDTPSKINGDITQSIINEWVKQFMSSKSVCCYEDDINILFNYKSKLELMREMYPEENILLFEMITDEKLLKAKERLTKGVYLKKNYNFDILTKSPIMEKPIYILLSVNNTVAAFLAVRDNANFKSYFPADMSEKDIIDDKLKAFIEAEGFNYVKDIERLITKDQKKFLPAVGVELWREDFCFFGLMEILDNSKSFNKMLKYSITSRDYSRLYKTLANFAMGLK
jgi:hypothetical protein